MARGKYERWLTEEGLTLLEGWARDGLTDEQIAGRAGIGTRTLYEWKERFPPVAQALRKGKEIVDIQVENALLKRALGYSYTEVMVEESENGTKRRETVKQMPPEVAAQIFWLKNRRPDRWRDRPETRQDREDGGNGVIILAGAAEEADGPSEGQGNHG